MAHRGRHTAVRASKAPERSADVVIEAPMSTRSSIWLGESDGRHVHIYWELADREIENGRMLGAPIYLAVDAGNPDQEIAIRLPKDMAIRLLTILSDKFAEEIARIV